MAVVEFYGSPEMVVVVPSRGRPEAARTLYETFGRTCRAGTALVFAVDTDDDQVQAYVDLLFGDADSATSQEATVVEDEETGLVVIASGSGDLFLAISDSTCFVEAVNRSALHFAQHTGARAIGCMNDDHAPRTDGWDARFLAALDEMGTGVVYANDLLQGERLPTQLAITADVVRELGYYGPPVLRHLYVDDVWLTWGRSLRRLAYLDDVVIEHLHPAGGKVAWTEGHSRVNSDEAYQFGQQAFARYMLGGDLSKDLAKIQRLVLREELVAAAV